MHKSVQPEWCTALPLQQQSVLLLAARGPDGIAKDHPCKEIQRAYRGTVFLAAKYGRLLKFGEKADSFMSLNVFADPDGWAAAVKAFFHTVDSLPHHFVMHLMHGAQILGYKHPDNRFAERWRQFYCMACEDMHLTEETEEEMDRRLSDWMRKLWSE